MAEYWLQIYYSKMKKLKDYNPSACSCNGCQAACMSSPCFPTPEQVERLINAGYKEDLRISFWADVTAQGADDKKFDIFKQLRIVVAPKSKGKIVVGDNILSPCSLFKDGKCMLHNKGLKPLEGTLIDHNMTQQDTVDIRNMVCDTWVSDKGVEILKLFEDDADLKQVLNNETMSVEDKLKAMKTKVVSVAND